MADAKHPFCNICGWRKGGVDSWNGAACKCGKSEPPLPLCPRCGKVMLLDGNTNWCDCTVNQILDLIRAQPNVSQEFKDALPVDTRVPDEWKRANADEIMKRFDDVLGRLK